MKRQFKAKRHIILIFRITYDRVPLASRLKKVAIPTQRIVLSILPHPHLPSAMANATESKSNEDKDAIKNHRERLLANSKQSKAYAYLVRSRWLRLPQTIEPDCLKPNGEDSKREWELRMLRWREALRALQRAEMWALCRLQTVYKAVGVAKSTQKRCVCII